MLSKQLTTKLKEEQEKENEKNQNHLNVIQCDRIIRTVSCKVYKYDEFLFFSNKALIYLNTFF